jgi:hypothetical protein
MMGGGAGTGGGNSGGSAGSGSAFSCTPDKLLCDGNKLYLCTRSGGDAVFQMDCGTGSANNPRSCFDTECAGGVCCRYSKPTCEWSVTAPFVSAGKTYLIDQQCNPPRSGTDFTLYETGWCNNPQPSGLCKDRADFSLTLSRPNSPLPWKFDLSRGEASLLMGFGARCAAGTITVNADVPHWSVDIDCKDPLSVSFAGTFSGESP